MKKAATLVTIAFIAAIIFIQHPVKATSWSLLPSVIAIFIAFISNNVFFSLIAAVIMGSFIFFYGESGNLILSVFNALKTTGVYFYNAGSDKNNLQILGFVFFIFMTVHVMTKSGGLEALVDFLKKWIVGPRSAQLMTTLFGCFIFIDDYTNTMVVGSSMKKITDRYGISREKLAFLVDSTSAPIAGVAFVSTWIGYEVGLFNEMAKNFSWSLDGYGIFLDAIGFRFYCFMMLIFVFVNCSFGIDFGPMKNKSGNPTKREKKVPVEKTSILCVIIPLLTLLGLVFSLLWYDGGGTLSTDLLNLTHWRQVLTHSKNGILILFTSAFIGYLTALITAFLKSSFSSKDIFQALVSGLKSAGLPIGILILSWSLKLVCEDLNTAKFIVSQLENRLNLQFLPSLVFIVSALTAFSIGTSWGTMAVLIPTVMPLAVALNGGDYGPFVSMSLAAILDGAIMGDHCSPISDTTIMSAASTDCDLLAHVKTQFPYSLLVGFLAVSLGYLPAAYGFSSITSLGMALVLMIFFFQILKLKQKI